METALCFASRLWSQRNSHRGGRSREAAAGSTAFLTRFLSTFPRSQPYPAGIGWPGRLLGHDAIPGQTPQHRQFRSPSQKCLLLVTPRCSGRVWGRAGRQTARPCGAARRGDGGSGEQRRWGLRGARGALPPVHAYSPAQAPSEALTPGRGEPEVLQVSVRAHKHQPFCSRAQHRAESTSELGTLV